jgi:hypothetical protein
MYNELDFRTLRTLLGGVTIWRCMCGNTTGIAEAADGRGPSVYTEEVVGVCYAKGCHRRRVSAKLRLGRDHAAVGVDARDRQPDPPLGVQALDVAWLAAPSV